MTAGSTASDIMPKGHKWLAVEHFSPRGAGEAGQAVPKGQKPSASPETLEQRMQPMKTPKKSSGSRSNAGSEGQVKDAERPAKVCPPTTKPARAKRGEASSALPKGQPEFASPHSPCFADQVEKNPLVSRIVLQCRDRKQIARAIQRLNSQMLSTCVEEVVRIGHSLVDDKDRHKAWAAAAKLLEDAKAEIKSPGSAPQIRNSLLEMLKSFETACAPLELVKDEMEKELRKSARTLPVWPWAKQVRGFGALGLAIIVGEVGDLSAYPSKSKLWKRLGVGMVGGERQKKCKDPALAIEHGYSPERRAAMWAIADSMFRHQIRSDKDENGEKSGDSVAIGPYGKTYVEAKAREREKQPDISKAHAHNRAKRKMEKHLIKDLWVAWRGKVERDVPRKPRAVFADPAHHASASSSAA